MLLLTFLPDRLSQVLDESPDRSYPAHTQDSTAERERSYDSSVSRTKTPSEARGDRTVSVH